MQTEHNQQLHNQRIYLNDFKHEILRLATFINYPKTATKSAIILAADGFIYTGSGIDDTVMCYACCGKKNNWLEYDDVSKVHKTMSPSCSMAVGVGSDNVFIYVTSMFSEDIRGKLEMTARPNLINNTSVEASVNSRSLLPNTVVNLNTQFNTSKEHHYSTEVDIATTSGTHKAPVSNITTASAINETHKTTVTDTAAAGASRVNYQTTFLDTATDNYISVHYQPTVSDIAIASDHREQYQATVKASAYRKMFQATFSNTAIESSIRDQYPTSVSCIATASASTHQATVTDIATASANTHQATVSDIATDSANTNKATVSDIATASANKNKATVSDIATASANTHQATVSDISTASANKNKATVSDITTASAITHQATVSDIATASANTHQATVSDISTASANKNKATVSDIATDSANTNKATVSDIATASANKNKATVSDITTASAITHQATVSDIATASANTHQATVSDISTASANTHQATVSDISTASANKNKATVSDISTASANTHQATVSDIATASANTHQATVSDIATASASINKATVSDITTASARTHQATVSDITTASASTYQTTVLDITTASASTYQTTVSDIAAASSSTHHAIISATANKITLTDMATAKTSTFVQQHTVSNNVSSKISNAELGIVTESAKYKEYVKVEIRVKTLHNSSSCRGLDVNRIGESGFFREGIQRGFVCYFCGGGLDWDEEDDPFVKHAMWFPNCGHILELMGPHFVQTVQELARTTQRVTFDMVMGRLGRKASLIPNPTLHNDPAVKVMLEAEYNKEHVLKAARELRLEGCVLTVDVLERKIKHSTGTVNHDTETESKDNTTSDAVKLLKESNLALRQQTVCKICKTDDVQVVFLPCGHLMSCVECAQTLSQCLLCQGHIKGIVRAFLSFN